MPNRPNGDQVKRPVVPYEMTTPVGKAALAQRDAAAWGRYYDDLIEARLQELKATDPVLLALATLRRVAVALPPELLARGYTPLLAGPDEPIEWKPPQPERVR
jgi:hypothetical protein